MATSRVTYTKTDVKKLLVAERKAMRTKQQESAFLRRTLSIYNGMKSRAKEERKLPALPFALDEFRTWADKAISQGCYYCSERLTVAKFTADHAESIAMGGSFEMDNLRGADKQCNYRKGMMRASTFRSLQAWAAVNCDDRERADLWRRLSLGGKWAGKQ